MSTQAMQLTRDVIVQRSGRRVAVAASIVTALFAGTLVGRVTAPDSSSAVVRPATSLTTVGESSVGDVTRAEMFGAMNGLASTAQPATELRSTGRASSDAQRRSEMFWAIDGLRRGRI
jgi:hypothetical protein